MKKWIVLLLVLLLAGCSAPPAEEQPPAVPETPPVAEQPQETPQEQPLRYETDTTLLADTLYAEDGTQLLHYAIQVPFLTVWREDGTQVTQAQNEAETQALAAVETFRERFADWHMDDSFAEYEEAAKEQLTWFRQEGFDWNSYQMELNCSIYQTERLISISGIWSSYTGGAHPNTNLLSWNFDLESGTFFGPEALAEQMGLQETVAAELVRQAQANAAEYGEEAEMLFWPEYKDIIADWPSYAVSFDETGMTVAFSPYELAAYAAGPQVFHISYEWLMPHLDETALAVLGLAAE